MPYCLWGQHTGGSMHCCETIISSITQQPNQAGKLFSLQRLLEMSLILDRLKRLVLEREKSWLRGPEAAGIHLHYCNECSHQRGRTCRLCSLQWLHGETESHRVHWEARVQTAAQVNQWLIYTDAQSGFQKFKTSIYGVEMTPLLRCLPLTELYKYCPSGLLLLQHVWIVHCQEWMLKLVSLL